MPEKLIHLFSSWRSIGATIRSTKFGDSLLHALLWEIWQERNNKIFLSKARRCEEVIEAIIREFSGWLKSSSEFKELILADFLRDWVMTISCLSIPNQPHRSLC